MKNNKIIVIKIGSSVLLTHRNKLDEFRVSHIGDQIIDLKKLGIDVILVISGAVAFGSRFININFHNNILKQAAAGIGQVYITSIFNNIFQQKKLQIAQILLTKNDLCLYNRQQQLISIIKLYLNYGYIPLFNENDVIEINSFKGNDYLAAEITKLIGSEKLIILSTMKGSSFSIGGGKTKQDVQYSLEQIGIKTQIMNGKIKNILLKTKI